MWVPGYVTTAARIRGWTFIVPITCSATCLPFTSNKFICFWRQELLVHLMRCPAPPGFVTQNSTADLLHLLPQPFMGWTTWDLHPVKSFIRTTCPQYSSRFHGHTKELVGKRHFQLAFKNARGESHRFSSNSGQFQSCDIPCLYHSKLLLNFPHFVLFSWDRLLHCSWRWPIIYCVAQIGHKLTRVPRKHWKRTAGATLTNIAPTINLCQI